MASPAVNPKARKDKSSGELHAELDKLVNSSIDNMDAKELERFEREADKIMGDSRRRSGA